MPLVAVGDMVLTLPSPVVGTRIDPSPAAIKFTEKLTVIVARTFPVRVNLKTTGCDAASAPDDWLVT